VSFVSYLSSREGFEVVVKHCSPLDLPTVAAKYPRWWGGVTTLDLSSVAGIVQGDLAVFGACGALKVLNLNGCERIEGAC
jgi:hypothetical protein